TYEQEDSYKFHGAKTRTTNIELTGKVAFNPEHPFFADFNYLKSLLPVNSILVVLVFAPWNL
ncbi:hypothetical protein ACI3PH_17550, partial [Lactococcus lactis]